uniref:Uncharacterized protein n=1 Tax=Rhizophagus irregularis (strain DAOM 181602 / DAOM 197198 / MUCL 43194) TaxID=747089 RepID=U9U111_RHIID
MNRLGNLHTALNDDFTKRLKDENKSVDEKNLNEKRLKISPPAKNSKPLKNQECEDFRFSELSTIERNFRNVKTRCSISITLQVDL